MNKKKIISFLIVFNLFVSIGYSNLIGNFSIAGDAMIRVQKDLRITKLKVLNKSSDVIEKSNYNLNSTSMNISILKGSTITYQVTITNKTSLSFTLDALNEINCSNNNVLYEVNGIEVGGLYNDEVFNFTIEVTASEDDPNFNLDLEFILSVKEQSWDFPFEKKEKTFNIPYNGVYRLEVWGAQGGNDDIGIYNGGYGGYSVGEMSLSAGTTLYINVGGQGDSGCLKTSCSGGYNGGGNGGAYLYDDTNWNGGGGGATHIATRSGVLSSLGSYKGTYSSSLLTYESSVILIVAGGGGGGMNRETDGLYGGGGGGFDGGASHASLDNGVLRYAYSATGGTQTDGGSHYLNGSVYSNQIKGSFGKGGTYKNTTENYNAPGGGGGFFGGGNAGGGGSGYIGNPNLSKKVMYCFDCTQKDGIAIKSIQTTDVSDSAVSKYVKIGNGFARISLVSTN